MIKATGLDYPIPDSAYLGNLWEASRAMVLSVHLLG
jgi:hypothetical protein